MKGIKIDDELPTVHKLPATATRLSKHRLLQCELKLISLDHC